jgi:DNA helicase HerA-like ATPase
VDFEKLGSFYLGKVWDPQAGEPRDELLLYDSKDLTTHALCVGMTGSGKTGLCISLLEEAAIDGIPALAIDPKGDLGNLLLTFPKLDAASFEPWIDPAEAARKGETVEAYAAKTARTWKAGLADWGQDGKRIRRLRERAEVTLYTPGSRSGRPLRVLKSLDAPPAAVADDPDAMADRVSATVSALLALLDVDADPIRSREHILLSNLLNGAWSEGRSLDFARLVGEIQQPPFERLGVLDLESFFPAAERFELAMRMNNLLASPGFAAWMEGEPLDIGQLLYTPDGRPRIAVLSIAHLDDRERMFFVTQILNELVAWMRGQSGTSSLRALLYMDEIFGYFPPSANPPSKKPMLTLLKQARAFGIGCVLSTQNPVDLDYKGLSNCGTWFLGRLQAERDKLRVLDGLEGAAGASGSSFDRAEMDRMLSGLGSRVFLMNNVHEDAPVLFHTRWALSYLRGPLTREQIRRLSKPEPARAAKSAAQPRRTASSAPRPVVAAADPDEAKRPVLPPEVSEQFLSPAPIGSATLVWRPALFGSAQLHYADRSGHVDQWEDVFAIALLEDPIASDPWADADFWAARPALEPDPPAAGSFSALSAKAVRAKSYTTWGKKLSTSLYRSRPITVFKHAKLKRTSNPEQSEAEFRGELRHLLRERRDLSVEKLRKRYAPKLMRLAERVRVAETRVEKEQDQVKQQKMSTVVSMGATVLGALFGRKVKSIGTVGRAASTARGVGRIAREKGDVARAEQKLIALQEELDALEAEFQDSLDTLEEPIDVDAIELTERSIRPRKGDLNVEPVSLVWTPWSRAADGSLTPMFDRSG